MQAEIKSFSEFSERTEELAHRIERNLKDLPALLGVSPSMFWGYRTGKYPISAKAWRKLAAAEAKAGIIKTEDKAIVDKQVKTALSLREAPPAARSSAAIQATRWAAQRARERFPDDLAAQEAYLDGLLEARLDGYDQIIQKLDTISQDLALLKARK